MKGLLVVGSLVGGGYLGTSGTQAASYIAFDAPRCQYTLPVAINAKDQVAGNCEDDFGSEQGFLREPDGTVITFDLKHLASTSVHAINRKAAIAGLYRDQDIPHGYVRKAHGHTKVIKIQNSTGTEVWAINDSGTIAGDFSDTAGVSHGFIRDSAGVLTEFDVPGSAGTFGRAIDNNDTVAGMYAESQQGNHGYVRFADGTFQTFDPADSHNTFVYGMSENGIVAGNYVGSCLCGFLRDANGAVTTFAAPDGGEAVDVTAVNRKGTAAGAYYDSLFVYHGFVRTADGPIVSFDVPGAIDTYAKSIASDGTIAGYFDMDDGSVHGFIRTP